MRTTRLPLRNATSAVNPGIRTRQAGRCGQQLLLRSLPSAAWPAEQSKLEASQQGSARGHSPAASPGRSAHLWVWPDEAVKVSALKLVRVTSQQLQVSNAVVGGTRREDIPARRADSGQVRPG